MADSTQAPNGLARTFFSEAGLMSAFAMRAVRVAFQPPFELREVVHQVYMVGWRSLPLVMTSGLAIGVVLSMHTRASAADTIAIMRDEGARDAGGVMHCFTGEEEHAKASLDLGFNLSFAGNLTYPKAQNIRDAAKLVPEDRYFIETDCPYLAPIPYRGKRNEPAYVVSTALAIGELRGQSGTDIGIQTAKNFASFFGIQLPGR